MSDKKYKIGYVAGVFDLFHVGHLNLIERAKTQCDYLIVGVLTDELVLKNKNKLPYIPFEERLRIIGALKNVDKAVGVDDSNIQKMDAWKQFHFDCLFSGNDYSGNKYWIEDKAALNAVGSNIEFFPYTKSTSSTQIKKAMGVTLPKVPEKPDTAEGTKGQIEVDCQVDKKDVTPITANVGTCSIEGKSKEQVVQPMKIWAHRGCSYNYPENTVTSFSKAVELYECGLTGIETDIQLTKDGHMVVIHDESIDRTTNGHGCVKDFTLDDLRQFSIDTGDSEHPEHIPTIEEVLDLLEDSFKRGLLLNIELKNSFFSYEGMEEKILKLIEERGLNGNIVYSSFSIKSMAWIKQLNSMAHTALLSGAISETYWTRREVSKAEALHPIIDAIDVDFKLLKESGMPIRAWMRGPLYPNKYPECIIGTAEKLNIEKLREKSITDIFVNDPENFL